MLGADEVLDAWRRSKTGKPFYRLSGALGVSFEFRGPQWGHPSNFAAIQILAEPADHLAVDLPSNLLPTESLEYRGALARAIGIAAVDELLTAEWYGYRGCLLRVREVGWDEVMSSEMALYRATRGACQKLRREGRWEFVARP